MLTDRLGQAIVRGCLVMEVVDGSVLVAVTSTSMSGSCDTADCVTLEYFSVPWLDVREHWLLAQWQGLRLHEYEVVGYAS
jgi:hypothetical protein